MLIKVPKINCFQPTFPKSSDEMAGNGKTHDCILRCKAKVTR